MTSSKPVGPPAKLHPFRGEMLPATEIARRMGLEASTIRFRAKRWIPLDAPNHCGMTDSGEFKIGSAADHLYWADDLEARVWHMYCGGDDFGECTLDEIAGLWDLTRERIRQIEAGAFAKIRQMVKRGNRDAVACLELFRERAEQRSRRRATHWEWAESQAPGIIELSAWEKSHSHSVVAALSGRNADVNRRAVEGAKRGNQASRRVPKLRRRAS